MEEKYMINDILESISLELNYYKNAICHTQNLKFRQTLQKIRDSIESFQYEVLQIAQIKGYYKEEKKVTIEQINKTRNELEN